MKNKGRRVTDEQRGEEEKKGKRKRAGERKHAAPNRWARDGRVTFLIAPLNIELQELPAIPRDGTMNISDGNERHSM